MSSSIDTRIVQMQFENSQFEKGVSESLKTLEELRKNLEFDKEAKNLENLQRAGNSFSLARMANGIEEIESRFSALEVIGRRALENLTDSVMHFGKSFVKSVTIDPISTGFGKYADQTKSVQTIIAATGQDIKDVEAELNKLMWFTDETSYSFTDMVSNVGKFTSAGVDLQTAVQAMMGISNWAAVSGGHINEAGRAMYNLSQSIGMGYVGLMDWKSIELANMGTKEFKETAIETAKAMGVLDSAGRTAKGTAVTFENFRETLKEKWFTSDVLLTALNEYGDFAQKAYELTQEYGISAAEAMDMLSGQASELSEKSFRAAQEAKTFTEAIDAVKDAVSSGWMTTFKYIFGNYDEARVVWTKLANDLWDIFAAGGEARNEILEVWHALKQGDGGYIDLIQGLSDAMDSLVGIVESVRMAFDEIFTDDNKLNTLKSITSMVRDLGANLKKLFAPKFLGTKITYKTEFEQLNPLGTLKEDLKRGLKGNDVKAMQKRLKELGFDVGAVDGIFGPKTEKALNAFKEKYGLTLDGIYDETTHWKLAEALEEKGFVSFSSVRKRLVEVREEIYKYPDGFELIKNVLKGLFGILKFGLSTVALFVGIGIKVLGVFSPVANMILKITNAVSRLFAAIGEELGSGSDIFSTLLSVVDIFLLPIKNGIDSICKSILRFLGLSDDLDNIDFTAIAKKIVKPILDLKEQLDPNYTGERSGLAKFLLGVGNAFKNGYNAIKKWITDKWERVRDFIKACRIWFNPKWTGKRPKFVKFLMSIGPWFKQSYKKAKEWLGKKWEDLKQFIEDVKQWFNPKWTGERPKFVEFLFKVGDWFKTAFANIRKWLFGNNTTSIGKGIASIIEQLSPNYTGKRSGFVVWILSVRDKIKEAYEGIVGAVSKKWNWVREQFDSIKEQLSPSYEGERYGFVDWLLGLKQGIENAWTEIETFINTHFGLGDFIDQLNPNYDKVPILNEEKGTLSYETRERTGLAKTIYDIIDAVNGAYSEIQKWFDEHTSLISSAITNFIEQLNPNYEVNTGENRTGAAAAIYSAYNSLKTEYDGLIEWLDTNIPILKSTISNFITQLNPNYEDVYYNETKGTVKQNKRTGLAKKIYDIIGAVGIAYGSVKKWFDEHTPLISGAVEDFIKQMNPEYTETTGEERTGLAKILYDTYDGLTEAWGLIQGFFAGLDIGGFIEQMNPDYGKQNINDTGILGERAPHTQKERTGLAKAIYDIIGAMNTAYGEVQNWFDEHIPLISTSVANFVKEMNPSYTANTGKERTGLAKILYDTYSDLSERYEEAKAIFDPVMSDIKKDVEQFRAQMNPEYTETTGEERTGLAKILYDTYDGLTEAWGLIQGFFAGLDIGGFIDQLNPNYEEVYYNETKGTVKQNKRTGLAKTIYDVIDALDGAYAKLSEWFSGAWETIKEKIQEVITEFGKEPEERKGFAGFITDTADALSTAFTKIKSFVFDTAWPGIKGWFEKNGPEISTAISGFASGFWNAVGVLFNGEGSGENGEASNTLESVILTIRQVIIGIIDAIGLLLTGTIGENSSLSDEFQKRILKIRSTLSTIFNSVMYLVTGNTNYKTNLPKGIPEKIDEIRGWLTPIINSIKSFFGISSKTESTEIDSSGVEKELSTAEEGLSIVGTVASTISGLGIAFAAEGTNSSSPTAEVLDKLDKTTSGLGGISGIIETIGGAVDGLLGEGSFSAIKSAGAALGIMRLGQGVGGILDSLAWIRGGEDRKYSQKIPIIQQIAMLIENIGYALMGVAAAIGVIALIPEDKVASVETTFQTIMNTLWVFIRDIGLLSGGTKIIDKLEITASKGSFGGKSSNALDTISDILGGLAGLMFGIIAAAYLLPDDPTELEDLLGPEGKIQKLLNVISGFIGSIVGVEGLGKLGGDVANTLGEKIGLTGSNSGINMSIDFGDIASFIASIAGLAAEIGALSLIPKKTFDTGVTRVGELAVGILGGTGLVEILGKFSNDASGRNKIRSIGPIFAGIGAMLGAVTGLVALLSNQDVDYDKGIERLKEIGSMTGIATLAVEVLGGLASLGETKLGVNLLGGSFDVAAATAIFGGVITFAGALIATLLDFIDKTPELFGGEAGHLGEFIEGGAEIAGKIGSFLGKLIGGFTAGYKAMQQEYENDAIEGFGEAVMSLSKSFEGIELDENFEKNVDAAITAVTKIHDLFNNFTDDVLTDTSFDRFTEFTAVVNSYLGDKKNEGSIKKFGDSINSMGTDLSEVDDTILLEKVPIAISAARQVAYFLEQLGGMNIETKAQGVAGWFANQTSGETVLGMVEKLGTSISGAANALAGVTLPDGATISSIIGEATAAVQSVAGLLVYLQGNNIPSGEELQFLIGPEGKLQQALVAVYQIGDAIKRAQDNADFSGLDMTYLNTVGSAVKSITDILNGVGKDSFSSKNFLSNLNATEVVTKLSTFTSDIGASVLENSTTMAGYAQTFNSSGSELAGAMAGGMGDSSELSTAAIGVVGKAAGQVKSHASLFAESGKNLMAGLAGGITLNLDLAVTAGKLAAQKVLDGMNETFDEASPSKETEKSGKYLDEGLAEGITKNSYVASEAGKRMVEETTSTLKDTLTTLAIINSEDFEFQPTITPVVDSSNIEAASGYMSSVFSDRKFALQASAMAYKASSSVASSEAASYKSGSPDVVDAVNSMSARISDLGEQLTNLKIVMNSGALVGQIARDMDNTLGYMAVNKGRMG